MRQPAPGRGLSGKILVLTVAFLLIGEALIYIPSIARFRLVFLEERIAAAHLATITLDADGARRLAPGLGARLLERAGVLAIALHRPATAPAELMLGEPRPVDATIDLRAPSPMRLIPDALRTLAGRGERTLRVLGHSRPRRGDGTLVDIILPERPLRAAMVDYSVRILSLSLALSAGVALCLFLSLQLMIVRPLRRVTGAMVAFRRRPEDATLDGVESGRADEIGVVERELATMREDLRRALVEKTRLAALGAAVGRMSHDLRNLLATAVLVSDRLEASPDPEVRRTASTLVDTLDRAIRLCADTLSYARSRPAPPEPRPVRPLEAVERVRAALAERPEPVRWRVEVDPGLELRADPDQLHRVLLNLARNAYEAMGPAGGELAVVARAGPAGLRLSVADTGPGVPERVRQRLFEPFAGTSKADGSGLGLAICRELMRAQGGEITLRETSPAGTIFELQMPSRALIREAGAATTATSASRSRPMATTARTALLPLLLAGGLASCSWQGPGIAGYEGLQFKVRSFYDTHAMEKGATCTQPRMTSVTRAQVVEETPERVVMNIKYHFRDEGQADYDSDDPFPPFGGGGFLNRCDDFAERTFTFAKRTDGSLDVVAMTGEQRR
jgi:signal transduction histidine kinase